MTTEPARNRRHKLALGVDRGGTRTRVVLINGRGAVLKRRVFPTSGFRRLPALVRAAAAAWQLEPGVPAVIASRGVLSKEWRRPFLLEKLKGHIGLIEVISDAQAAYLAAHGGGQGALLIAGTGSVVFIRLRGPGKARFRKVGGLGHAGGDPGSGLWLGNRYLRTLTRPGGKRLDRRARASYAARAIRKAERGDGKALALVREAHAHLSRLLARALAAHARSGGKKRAAPLKVALAGGLMENGFFRKSFIAAARRRLAPARVRFTGLRRTAERAAAELALSLYARTDNP